MFSHHPPPRQWLVLAAVASLAVASPAPALPGGEPVTQNPCPQQPAAILELQWDTQLESLAFDNTGNLIVSDIGGHRLLWLDASGLRSATPWPVAHGITFDPASGDFFTAGLLADGTGPEDVVRFSVDPEWGIVGATTHARGLETVNGIAVGPHGEVYLSSPQATQPPYLLRVDPDGSWAPWRDRYGPNGLWTADGGLYATIAGDQSSPVVHIPFDGSPERTVAELSTGAATLQPGAHKPSGPASPVLVPKALADLVRGPDYLYVLGHLTGEVIRVDPTDGSACLLADGLEQPTSIRIAPPSWGEHAGDLYVTDMGGIGVTALVAPSHGALWRLDLV